MIEKINALKTTTKSNDVKVLCEGAIATLSSAIYNNVTPDAKFEIERVAITNLFEGLSKIDESDTKNWLNTEKRLYTLKNLGLREAINTLLRENNNDLKDVLDEYKEHLDNGVSETLIYEQFISALQSFSYFPTVGNAIKAVEDRVSQYKSDVDITKIIETMKATRSSYLVPLIEDVVNNYIANKNEQTKHQLKETLVKFTYDPFVRDIVSLVTLDATDLQLEYANAECDIEKIYSPLMYIGENEVIFNVKGTYYIKKGNNINRLPQNDYSKLDERFVAFCDLINEEDIVFDRKAIKLYDSKNKAVITESSIEVNGQELSNDDFKTALENSYWGGSTDFFLKVNALKENFNDIAEVDFAKRVYLKEDVKQSADVFKLRDNVFISTNDLNEGSATFYRNINPIQAKHIMMQHLRYDISKVFESVLPDEEKILSQIEETKQSYSEYIKLLENKISQFNNEPKSEVTDQVLEALQSELNEVKEEFKDYLNRAEAYTRAPEYINEEDQTDSGITVTIDVHGKKYTVPIPDEATKDIERTSDNLEDTGTEVGAENIEDTSASAVTFDDDESEELSDTPSIDDDEVNLGSDEVEADADAAEAEAEVEDEEDKKDQEEEAQDNEKEEESDLEDEEDKKDKTEESSEKPLKEEGMDEKPKKRKVYLKKKKA